VTRGLFIVFEGPEGAGKSTQIGHLKRALERAGRTPLTTREPGGTPASDAIREVLLDPQLIISPLSEFLLYSASRAQHVSDVIIPALATGKTVISDRFSGASVAYQGYGRGLELGFVHDLNTRVSQGVAPDLTILLDLEPLSGLERVDQRGRKDRLEQADLAFHQRVRHGFLRQAEDDSSWVVLEADRPEGEVAGAIWRIVRERLLSPPL
jgi:dTMP kinase